MCVIMKWQFGNYLFLMLFMSLCVAGCTEKNGKEQNRTETLSAKKEGQKESKYLMSVSGMGFSATYVQDMCEIGDYIFLLAMSGSGIEENNNDIFLLRCEKDSSNAVRMDLSLEKKEILNSIVGTEKKLYLLTSVKKKNKKKYYWKTIDEEGIVLESRELKLKTESDYLFSQDAVVSDNFLYVLSEDNKSIRVFDEEGKENMGIDSNFSLSSLFMTGDGSIYTHGDSKSGEVFSSDE